MKFSIPKINSGISKDFNFTQGNFKEKVYTDSQTINARFDEFNKQLLSNTATFAGSQTNPFLKQSKKPKVNRAKNFIEKANKVMISQEHRDCKKAYIDRILEIKHDRDFDKKTLL